MMIPSSPEDTQQCKEFHLSLKGISLLNASQAGSSLKCGSHKRVCVHTSTLASYVIVVFCIGFAREGISDGAFWQSSANQE